MRSSVDYAALSASSNKQMHYPGGIPHHPESLIATLKTGQYQKSIYLINLGIKIKKQSSNGKIAGGLWFFCAHLGQMQQWNKTEATIVADLLLNQSLIKEHNTHGDTPLTCVLKSHFNDHNTLFAKRFAEQLKMKNYDINELNCQGNTVLFTLAHGQRTENVKMAVELGADSSLNLKNFGHTVLHMIAEREGSKLMDICLKNISNINVQDPLGQTALSAAVRKHAKNHIVSLMTAGASAEIADYKGKTSLDYAQNQRTEEISKLLFNLHNEQKMKQILLNKKFQKIVIQKI